MRVEDTERGGLGGALARLADGLGRLLADHFALARVELREDLRLIARDAAMIAAFVPFVLIGYALLCVALATLLSTWVGSAGAFAIVGGVNLLVGGVGAAVAAGRLKQRPGGVMTETLAEAERTAAIIKRQNGPEAVATERRLGA